MAQINVIGYVAENIIPKQSQKGNAYVRFFLKECLSHNRNQIYQVWVWNEQISKLIRYKIKKGSLIWVTGSLELADFTPKDDQGSTKVLQIHSNDFGIIRVNPKANLPAESRNAESTPDSLPVELDGDRNQLPE